MLYKFQAKNKNGQLVNGHIESSSPTEVAKLLRQKDYFIIGIAEKGKSFDVEEINFSFSRVTFGTVVNFTRQLSTMITAGLPLVESLNLLKTQETNGAFKDLLNKVLSKIEGGESLSAALSEYPNHFNRIYTSSIKAGETSGKLDNVLQRLADNLEKERDFRGKITGAMIYPAVIVIAMIVLIFFMMTLVIPKMTEFFQSFNMKLPITTQILISTSNIFSNYWWLILLVGGVFFFLLLSWKKTDTGKIMWDHFLFKIPLWGALRKEKMLADISRTLGVLVEAGVPILESLQIISQAVESPLFQEGILSAAQALEKGSPLGASFVGNPVFPPLLGQMITVGEETGKLDDTLYRVSKFFETTAEQKVKVLTTAIEPIMIIILGIGVGFVVLSIVMPMYQVTQGI